MTASPVELPQLPPITAYHCGEWRLQREEPTQLYVGAQYTPAEMLAFRQQGVLAERERAAQIALSFANCGCDGKHGYCTVDDPPKDIAAAIRKGE